MKKEKKKSGPLHQTHVENQSAEGKKLFSKSY
jgi:hypothetical protein